MKYLIGNLKIILILKLKKYVKTQWLKYFKNYSKELFNYCGFIKKNKNKIGEVLSPLINLFSKGRI